MSRVGKLKIDFDPTKVQIRVDENLVSVEGPRGKLQTRLPDQITVELSEGTLVARRAGDDKISRSLHGLIRSLLANAVAGVTQGFQKDLDLVGIGYRAEAKGESLNLSLGFSHPIEFPVPGGIEIKVERAQKPLQNYVATISVSGNDKQQVGQIAADIRSLRPPDSYKGKGIRYADETVKLKVGKKGA